MKINCLFKTARNVCFEIEDGGIFFSRDKYKIYVNESFYGACERTVSAVYGLKPDTDYLISIRSEQEKELGVLSVHTDFEFVTLDVRSFGAKGDGTADDTSYIQAAIMACPKDSRVLLPKGIYRTHGLFLKSDISLELAKDAVLLADTDRWKYPILPGLIESYDEKAEYNLGTWEGNPLKMFTGVLCGINVCNVRIYGEGCVQGNASDKDWWENAKVMNGAFRPRLLFLNHCENIEVQGLLFENSPSWTIHPYFSKQLGFYDLKIKNPEDSPNTDGLDPESCENIQIKGIHFSLGDDCIAIKSGKIYMGKKYKVATRNVDVSQCLMEKGHGAVTIGSEMAAGIKDVQIHDCLFRHTDRGLRIKTRRGRGRDAVLNQIVFDHIVMDEVMTPFVVNCFYCCDPDGRTQYVQSKEAYPVDERTPIVQGLCFKNIEAKNCHVAAAFFDGLPEEKIKEIRMENVSISFADKAKTDVPAMSFSVAPCSKLGIYASNVEKLFLKKVQVEGQEGEKILLNQVDEVIED